MNLISLEIVSKIYSIRSMFSVIGRNISKNTIKCFGRKSYSTESNALCLLCLARCDDLETDNLLKRVPSSFTTYSRSLHADVFKAMETRVFRDVRYRDMNFETYIVPRVHHVHHRGRTKVFFITPPPVRHRRNTKLTVF